MLTKLRTVSVSLQWEEKTAKQRLKSKPTVPIAYELSARKKTKCPLYEIVSLICNYFLFLLLLLVHLTGWQRQLSTKLL